MDAIAPTSDISDTRVLIVNPMPSTNDANGRVERRAMEYLNANPSQRCVQADILRISVDVPDVSVHEPPKAIYATDPAKYDEVMERLQGNYYHGVHVLGAACDHVPFDNTDNRHLVTDIFDEAIKAGAGIFTICNGSFEYLNHVHKVHKGVNVNPDSMNAEGPNPDLLKIIGHFQNAVTEGGASNKAARQFKGALALTSVLPTGRVGFMADDAIERLAEQGKMEILSRSPNMNGRRDAQISALYDFRNKALCMAPHIEYGPNAIRLEAERDHQIPQGRTKTPPLAEIPDLYLKTDEQGRAPWYKAGIALYGAWVEAINPSCQVCSIQQRPPKVRESSVMVMGK